MTVSPQNRYTFSNKPTKTETQGGKKGRQPRPIMNVWCLVFLINPGNRQWPWNPSTEPQSMILNPGRQEMGFLATLSIGRYRSWDYHTVSRSELWKSAQAMVKHIVLLPKILSFRLETTIIHPETSREVVGPTYALWQWEIRVINCSDSPNHSKAKVRGLYFSFILSFNLFSNS